MKSSCYTKGVFSAAFETPLGNRFLPLAVSLEPHDRATATPIAHLVLNGEK